eukprot:scaffold76995_cov26-Prasinocladus_malaysianus.AAC.1
MDNQGVSVIIYYTATKAMIMAVVVRSVVCRIHHGDSARTTYYSNCAARRRLPRHEYGAALLDSHHVGPEDPCIGGYIAARMLLLDSRVTLLLPKLEQRMIITTYLCELRCESPKSCMARPLLMVDGVDELFEHTCAVHLAMQKEQLSRSTILGSLTLCHKFARALQHDIHNTCFTG